MGDSNNQIVIHVFSFTLVMCIHVLVWIFMKGKIKDDMDEAYSYASSEVNIDPFTYIANKMMLKKNNVPELPFSIMKIALYIIFSYLFLLFILLIAYWLFYVFHKFVLTGCVVNEYVTSIDDSDNFVLNIVKEYVLKHFIIIVETTCTCICIIVILSIIINILFKPAMLSKENTTIVVDAIMFMFLISIPFNIIANAIIMWVLQK